MTIHVLLGWRLSQSKPGEIEARPASYRPRQATFRETGCRQDDLSCLIRRLSASREYRLNSESRQPEPRTHVREAPKRNSVGDVSLFSGLYIKMRDSRPSSRLGQHQSSTAEARSQSARRIAQAKNRLPGHIPLWHNEFRQSTE
jgi:hypothetical protein